MALWELQCHGNEYGILSMTFHPLDKVEASFMDARVCWILLYQFD